VPLGLHRYHASKTCHFITFSCYQRRQLLAPPLREVFLTSLERMQVKYGFRVYGYVLMPEHVHMIISEPQVGTIATVMQALKVSVSKIRGTAESPLWQKRYYDHNVRDEDSFWDKICYMHRNPVKRGLVAKHEDWPWSSFRHYRFGEVGPVEIQSEWTRRRRMGLPFGVLGIPKSLEP
jgi:putative transposase